MSGDSVTANTWPKCAHTKVLRQGKETEILCGHVAEETNRTQIGRLAVNIVREADQTLPLPLSLE
jgi:hypothetical protein